MNHEEIKNGLFQLGYYNGWVLTGNEITLWENDEAQPTLETILEASKLWAKTEADKQAEAAAARAALLEKLGITEEEARLLLS